MTTKRYIEAVGRRKTAMARVRITPDTKGSFVVNDKALEVYFPLMSLQHVARQALMKVEKEKGFSVSARVSGGGIHAQADAVRRSLNTIKSFAHRSKKKDFSNATRARRNDENLVSKKPAKLHNGASASLLHCGVGKGSGKPLFSRVGSFRNRGF
jgi:small subunit ribosomal protein S9